MSILLEKSISHFRLFLSIYTQSVHLVMRKSKRGEAGGGHWTSNTHTRSHYGGGCLGGASFVAGWRNTDGPPDSVGKEGS